MNILILNWRDPKHPLAGGAEIALLKHAKYWQKKGSKVTWFASTFNKSKEKEKIDGITYIRKGSHFTVHLSFFILHMQGKLRDYDSIIDCFHFLPFFTPLYMKRSKIVALIHEVAKEVWFQNMPWPIAFIGYHTEPWFIQLYKNIPFITVSQSTKNDLEKMGVNKKNIVVIHNGVERPKQYKKLKKTKNPSLLFLGRVSKDKGIEDILVAYTQLLKKYPNVQLFIAGKEEKKDLLKTLLKKYSLDTHPAVYTFGFVGEKKKYELLQKSWLLLHASTKEGWGLTVIEANSFGTPVIGYSVPGLKDSIQHKKTGLLVHTNATALADGVEQIFEDTNMYRKLSTNAKKWASQFRWEKSTKKSWAMLKE